LGHRLRQFFMGPSVKSESMNLVLVWKWIFQGRLQNQCHETNRCMRPDALWASGYPTLTECSGYDLLKWTPNLGQVFKWDTV